MLEHPGNNRNNNTLEGSYKNLMNRPRISAKASNHRAFDGGLHGFGCRRWQTLVRRPKKKVEVLADQRIGVLVLLAPATPWYLPQGSLSNVEAPILMLIAEHDAYTPRWYAAIVLNGVPDRGRVTFKVIANAGHFSFLSPFPAHMKNPGFLPSTDPEGFDREKFYQTLPGDVLDYLDRILKSPPASFTRSTGPASGNPRQG